MEAKTAIVENIEPNDGLIREEKEALDIDTEDYLLTLQKKP